MKTPQSTPLQVETTSTICPTGYIILRVENPATNALRITTETLPMPPEADTAAAEAYTALADFIRSVVKRCSNAPAAEPATPPAAAADAAAAEPATPTT